MSDIATRDPIPVVFAADNGYAPQLGVAITSLVANARHSRYIVTVLDGGISQRNIGRLNQIVPEDAKHELRFVDMGQCYADLPTNAHMTTPAFYRLRAPEILPYDKFVYMDCDLVVNDDLQDLYGVPIGDNIFAAVRDGDIFLEQFVYKKKAFGFEEFYFRKLGLSADDVRGFVNTGVMVINSKAWTRSGLSSRAASFVSEHRPLLVDQDALNFLCRGKIHFLDTYWNTQTHILDHYTPKPTLHSSPPGVIHYASREKPWNSDLVPLDEYYWRYFADSPWAKDNHDLIRELGASNLELKKQIKRLRKRMARSSRDRFLEWGVQTSRALRKACIKQAQRWISKRRLYEG